MKNYDAVKFVFCAKSEPKKTYTGLVLDRAEHNQMVLALPWEQNGEYPPNDGWYIVSGTRRSDGAFQGTHSREGGDDDVSVTATWSKADEAYSGKWIEDSVTYDFSFDLS